METPLGKDALDHKCYPEVDRNAMKEYWGALCHKDTNVLEMLNQRAEAVKPKVYPPDSMMAEMGLKCTLVEGLTENEMGLAVLHNLFTVGIQAIPMKDLNIQGLDTRPDCFTASKGLKDNHVRMFYKEKGLEDNEMNMVIPVMSLFKHMHTLSKQSSEMHKLIGDICEVWSL